MMRILYPRWSKIVIAALGCAILIGYSAMGAPGIAKPDQRIVVTSNSSKKGDRLPVVSTTKPQANVPSPSTMVAPATRPPLGCDPMFSPIADPAHARLYRRCQA
jgi:hypothetical protein